MCQDQFAQFCPLASGKLPTGREQRITGTILKITLWAKAESAQHPPFQITFGSFSAQLPAFEPRTGVTLIGLRVDRPDLDGRIERRVDSMWQAGLAEYDLSKVEELLLTNSSIVGPLQPLAPLWQNSSVKQCDFWGLTDNDEFGCHLQTYFMVFRRQVIQAASL